MLLPQAAVFLLQLHELCLVGLEVRATALQLPLKLNLLIPGSLDGSLQSRIPSLEIATGLLLHLLVLGLQLGVLSGQIFVLLQQLALALAQLLLLRLQLIRPPGHLGSDGLQLLLVLLPKPGHGSRMLLMKLRQGGVMLLLQALRRLHKVGPQTKFWRSVGDCGPVGYSALGRPGTSDS